jgi:hypothetical protein
LGAKPKGLASMALDDHNANHSHQERSTAELSFDELAKDVASGTLSRRKALRMLGAALVGSALASIPGVAWADKGGNLECVKCCKEKYGPGRELGQCISAGARGECPVTCDGNGGGCPSGTTLCGGNCVSTDCPSSGQTLNPSTCKCECPAGQTCCNGACRDLFCGPNEGLLNLRTCQCEPCQDPDQVLCNGTCVNNACGLDQVFNYTTCQCESVTCVQCGANSQDCGRGQFTRCGTSSSGGRCDCLQNIEGGCSCVDLGPGATCAELEFCTRPTDCPAGKTCVVTNCNPTPCEGVCVDPCPNPGC